MRNPPHHVAIGKIVQAHGIKGELTVFPLTEREERFAAGGTVLLSRTAEGEEGLTPFAIEASRRHRDRFLVKLEKIDDRTQAEWYAGAFLVIPWEEAESAREEGEFFLHMLVGREVRSEDGTRLGIVADVVETAGRPLLEIAMEKGSRRMLPFVKEFVRSVEEGVVIVAPPAGWEEL